MSEYSKKTPPAPPKTERWLIVMTLAFVPAIAALFLPEATRIPLLAISGLTFIVGFVMMIRQSRTAGGHENLRRLVHPDSE